MFDLLSFLGLRPTLPAVRRPNRMTRSRPHDSPRPVHAPKVYGSDLTGFVGFNDAAFVIARLTDPCAPWLLESIGTMDRRVSGLHTNIADGLDKAVRMLRNTPDGMLRRIWLLSDGRPNPDGPRERVRVMQAVRQARDSRININAIGFGESRNFDADLLRKIAAATHHGRYVAVDTPRKLALALYHSNDQGLVRVRHRAEATIYAIDCSGSMVLETMGNQKKIDVVKDTLVRLLYHKQKLFSGQ